MAEYTFKVASDGFTVSPSPRHPYSLGAGQDDIVRDLLITGQPERFEWILMDNDKLIFAIDDDQYNYYLEFFPHVSSERKLPIVHDDNVYDGNKYRLIYSKNPPSIVIKQQEPGALWSFDICFNDGYQHFRIDPEIKIGTGTDRRR